MKILSRSISSGILALFKSAFELPIRRVLCRKKQQSQMLSHKKKNQEFHCLRVGRWVQRNPASMQASDVVKIYPNTILDITIAGIRYVCLRELVGIIPISEE